MSSKIVANTPFLSLLLTTSLSQQRALMQTLTDEQAVVILEILHNLAQLNHTPGDLGFLRKRKSFFRKFDKSVNLNKRKRLLHLHKTLALKTLQHFQHKLLDLL